jgi:hypothetical protein
VIGDEFVQAVEIFNPGTAAAVAGRADVWQSGAGDFDEEGSLVSTWTATFAPGTVVEPLADVLVDGRHLWVSGMPEARDDLLSGLADHVEATLKLTARPSVVAEVLRDSVKTDRNRLGDKVDTPTTVASGVTASIVERRTEIPTADGDLRTLTLWVGWVPIGTDVVDGDRIRTAAGTVYLVERITHPLNLGWREKRLELLLQTAAPVPTLFPEQP